MKKLLVLALALVMALGLCTPALAAETEGTYYVDGQSVDTYPAGEAVELMEELGILETPPMDEEYTYDPYDYEPYAYEEYAQAHPEEIAALDVDALIAGWGYKDMTAAEHFMAEKFNGWDIPLEEAVETTYIDNRMWVERQQSIAAGYKEEYPEGWASFEPDKFFAWHNGTSTDKEVFMAEKNILTEEEFVDVLFYYYCEYGYIDFDGYTDWGGPVSSTESTLTLVVNGVRSDVVISANDWTTYADAAALRAILGDQAVAPGYDGPVPIREAAENAGWDVVWYDNDWEYAGDQVCLWNKELMLKELEPKVEAYQQVVDAVEGLMRKTVFSETPLGQTQTATLTFKKFDTLDGDKTYTMKLRSEAVCQKGVADVTLTLDVSALADLLPADTVKYTALSMGLTADQLKEQLRALKVEAIVDFNEGATALRVPLLDQLNPGLGDWRVEYTSGLKLLACESYAQRLYESMVDLSRQIGGEWARQVMEEQTAAEKLAFEPDSLKKVGSTLTWELKTDQFNKTFLALDATAYPSLDGVDPFKKMELTLRVSGDESYDLSLALRPNMDCPGFEDQGDIPGMSFDLWMADIPVTRDFDLALTAHGDGRKANASMKLHVKNYGVFDLTSQTTTTSAGQGPRQIKDVERLWVEPAPGAILTQAK